LEIEVPFLAEGAEEVGRPSSAVSRQERRE
jgi:hypothetical protein